MRLLARPPSQPPVRRAGRRLALRFPDAEERSDVDRLAAVGAGGHWEIAATHLAYRSASESRTATSTSG